MRGPSRWNLGTGVGSHTNLIRLSDCENMTLAEERHYFLCSAKNVSGVHFQYNTLLPQLATPIPPHSTGLGDVWEFFFVLSSFLF